MQFSSDLKWSIYRQESDSMMKVTQSHDRDILELKSIIRFLILELEKNKVPGDWAKIKNESLCFLPFNREELNEMYMRVNGKIENGDRLTPFELRFKENFRLLERQMENIESMEQEKELFNQTNNQNKT